MITEKQCGRLRREFARTHNMKLSALKAGVDRKTARKYLQTQASPEQLQKPHGWRTRADPLAEVWPKASAMLSNAFKHVWAIGRPKRQATSADWIEQNHSNRWPAIRLITRPAKP